MPAARLAEQELVCHVFVSADGETREAADSLVRTLWSRCGDVLALDEEVVRSGLPTTPPGHLGEVGTSFALAARESSDRSRQAVLRRSHDVLVLSVLLAHVEQKAWPDLDRMLDHILDGIRGAPLGVVRIYAGKTGDAGSAVLATPELAEVVAGALSCGESGNWRHRGRRIAEWFALWEVGARHDARAERRLVVLGPPGLDWELGELVWYRGDPGLPTLVRYLLHIAKIRYEVRVRAQAAPTTQLCDGAKQSTAAFRRVLRGSAGPDTVTAGLADLRRHQLVLAGTITDTRAMRRTVEIAGANAARLLGEPQLPPDEDDPLGDDRAVAAWFVEQLGDDIEYLEATYEGVCRLTETAREFASPENRDASRPTEPTFGIVTALPEEFAAMRALVDGATRVAAAEDRATYFRGTMPSC